MKFQDILSKHMKDMKNSRYAAIECLIANYILTTGCNVSEIELVERTVGDEIRWSIEKKQVLTALDSSREVGNYINYKDKT